jgi:phosphate transport system protein
MTIALLAEELAGSRPCEFPIDIPRMAELSMAMVRKALQALNERDAELATSVLAMDDAVDEMNRRAKAVLLECIQKDSSAAQSAVNLLFISRSLERIADHATNMAEDVIFWVSGSDVRHGYALQSHSLGN